MSAKKTNKKENKKNKKEKEKEKMGALRIANFSHTSLVWIYLESGSPLSMIFAAFSSFIFHMTSILPSFHRSSNLLSWSYHTA